MITLKNRRSLLGLVSISLLLLAFGAQFGHAAEVFQVSTLQALLEGVYDGVLPLSELKQHGNLGIGTFEGLDGEMLLLDGVVYQVRADGKVYRPEDSIKTPFAAVVPFQAEHTATVKAESFKELETLIDRLAPNRNLPLVVRLEGTFDYVKTRSVPGQQKPYPRLAEVTKNQPTFEMTGVKGVIIGFRLPDFIKGVNLPGYHFHFIDEAKERGGHLLECRLAKGELATAVASDLRLHLPTHGDFAEAKLGGDRTQEFKGVER